MYVTDNVIEQIKHLIQQSWVVGIGRDGETVLVYTTRHDLNDNERALIPESVGGYAVRVWYVGGGEVF
ncbi:MAG: hypothetical protein AB1489_22830 [Acidobacteriota bacterium]